MEGKKKATVAEMTIAYGRNRFRVDCHGNWSVLMWGWWPNGGSTPSYRWVGIKSNKVPKEVLMKTESFSAG